MREMLLNAVRSHALGHITKHKANVEVYLNSAVGVGEHPNIIEVIEKELSMIGKYQEQIDVLDRHFSQIDYSQLSNTSSTSNSTKTANE